jgi:hypothetical protein
VCCRPWFLRRLGSRSLGYHENGLDREAPRGVARELRRFRLERSDWLASTRPPVTLEGLAECLPLLGFTS